MIPEHTKLAMQSFGVTPDPKFLYPSPTHREAMASLLHGIHSGRGFSALIAAPGMGKTTLLFNLLQILKGMAKTAFLFQTLCEPREFLNALLVDLGIEDDGNVIARMQAKLNEFLLREALSGRQVVVVIDEAQNLDDQVLEIVRMLSNFETPNKKLMHVLLAGQPQLGEKLASERLTQLRQRISIVARLAPLDADETRAYIEHRLRVAGHAGDEPLFTNQAYAMIARQSDGIPRNINNLCFNAMSLACALKRSKVDGSMVAETINDLDLATILPSTETKTESANQLSPSIQREARGFGKWRPTLLAATTLLLILLCLIFQAAKPPQPSPGVEVMPASAAVEGRKEKAVPHVPLRTKHMLNNPGTLAIGSKYNLQGNTNGTAPAKKLLRSAGHDERKNCDNCNPGSEQNVVPFESAAQREKP